MGFSCILSFKYLFELNLVLPLAQYSIVAIASPECIFFLCLAWRNEQAKKNDNDSKNEMIAFLQSPFFFHASFFV